MHGIRFDSVEILAPSVVDDHVAHFLAIISQQPKTVFVHCFLGVNRTGVMVAAYSIRHSFAAWSLLAGIEPLRMVSLMGHGSKKMIFETYGNYVEDLECDFWDVVNYFGKDYLEVKKKTPRSHYNFLCESSCESRGSEQHNQLIMLGN